MLLITQVCVTVAFRQRFSRIGQFYKRARKMKPVKMTHTRKKKYSNVNIYHYFTVTYEISIK